MERHIPSIHEIDSFFFFCHVAVSVDQRPMYQLSYLPRGEDTFGPSQLVGTHTLHLMVPKSTNYGTMGQAI
jgi:hypothetical protein